jgi:hypothetical protein
MYGLLRACERFDVMPGDQVCERPEQHDDARHYSGSNDKRTDPPDDCRAHLQDDGQHHTDKNDERTRALGASRTHAQDVTATSDATERPFPISEPGLSG